MAKPAVTDPPGVLMYSEMGFSGASASRKRSCATMDAETDSSTAPLRQMIRSINRRENMSCVRQPPPIVSVTYGVGTQFWAACVGGVEGGWGKEVVLVFCVEKRRRWRRVALRRAAAHDGGGRDALWSLSILEVTFRIL